MKIQILFYRETFLSQNFIITGNYFNVLSHKISICQIYFDCNNIHYLECIFLLKIIITDLNYSLGKNMTLKIE